MKRVILTVSVAATIVISLFINLSAIEIVPTRVAVVEFAARGSNVPKDAGVIISDYLVTELLSTKRYELLERILLSQVTAELGNNQSSAIDPTTAAEIGRRKGAQIIITGSVISSSGNISVSARFIDVETGSIIISESSDSGANGNFKIIAKKLVDLFIPIEDRDSEEIYSKAERLRKLGKLDTAMDKYKELIERYPLSPRSDDALLSIGKIYYSVFNYNDTYRLMQALIENFVERETVEDALFYSAESKYFRAFPNPDRDRREVLENFRNRFRSESDSTEARESIISRAEYARDAKKYYEQLLEVYPDTEYRETVRRRIEVINSYGG